MPKFEITCSLNYEGITTVEAKDFEEALEKVQKGLNYQNGKDDFPDIGQFGNVNFRFVEASADYADEID